MRAFYYIVSALYVAGLAYLAISGNGSVFGGYAIAVVWFLIYVITQEADRRHRKIMHEIISMILDLTTSLLNSARKATAKVKEELEKERAHWAKVEAGHQRRISDLQGVIKIYGRNEEEGKAKEA